MMLVRVVSRESYLLIAERVERAVEECFTLVFVVSAETSRLIVVALAVTNEVDNFGTSGDGGTRITTRLIAIGDTRRWKLYAVDGRHVASDCTRGRWIHQTRNI